MTWWPSVPTSAVIAPTIAGSSSTTRIRSARGGRGTVTTAPSDGRRGRQGDHESGAVPVRRLAPQSRPDRFGQPACGVQPDAGSPRRVRLAAGVGLEDPLAPLLGNVRPLVLDPYPDPTLRHPPVEADRRLGRRVLHRVLDQVLQDLAEAAR